MIAGKNFPMEAHFVHRADSGALAVVGVLMSTGKPNPAFAKIVSTMPAKEGPPVKADPAHQSQRAAAAQARLLSLSGFADDAALRGDRRMAAADRPDPGRGSRCRELRQTLSANARPVQKDNRRYVLQSS